MLYSILHTESVDFPFKTGFKKRSDKVNNRQVTGSLSTVPNIFAGATVKSHIATVLMPYHSARSTAKIRVQAPDYLSARAQLEALYDQSQCIGRCLIAKYRAAEALLRLHSRQRDIQHISWDDLFSSSVPHQVFRFSNSYQPLRLDGAFKRELKLSGFARG